ncbi:MAG: ATP phosphoribosyltransferase regulatory subunit [Actinomycetota bacterium]|nr:ATP phosphoribosyltransferase regulatory subunit [Actinomycetota bacterium]
MEGEEAEAEVIGLALSALDDVGLKRHRIGLGDGALYRNLLTALDVPPDRQDRLLERLSARDLVGLEAIVHDLGLTAEARDLLARLPALRGGPDVLDAVNGPVGGALDGLRRLHAALADRGMAERVILDLGLVRMLGYYTGAVYEVYDPAVGFTLGGGGRYDDLIGRFSHPRPACGVALDVQRVHMAQAAEEGLR